MANTVFESVKKSLEEAIAYEKGDATKARSVHVTFEGGSQSTKQPSRLRGESRCMFATV
ncbi:MAG: hypothetical protein J6I73_09940 [Treponema sp.]|nr:hypothetical protein [Treponema sp.]